MGKFDSIILKRGVSAVYMPAVALSGLSQIARVSPKDLELGNGVGSLQANLLYVGSALTRAASITTNIDLAGGSLFDPHGAALTFVKVKFIYIEAAKANVNNVIIKPGSANGFLGPFGDPTDLLKVKPGAAYLLEAGDAGWGVTAGTGDLLALGNDAAGSAVTFDLIIGGTDA